MTSTHEVIEPRSATTGEPVSVVARRNHLGVWLCIASDIAGTVSLLVAYSYLWSLNVNQAWAPPKNAFASPLPFWLITLGAVIGALLLWWGLRSLRAGRSSTMAAAAGLASVVLLATFVGQIVQLSTFPFGPPDGAYASATFWLCISAAFHLAMVVFLAMAILGRTRAGLVSTANPSHAHLVAIYTTWAAISIALGAIFATVMTTSPNDQSPPVGEFQQPPAAAASANPGS
ncbi:MAG: hypothetical protein GC156_03180 [Actinomycetales bacterium]|nr:hypothetical protein [Actinomycetales bacterium]